MAEKIDLENFLAVVNQTLQICVQATARTEALEYLLIDKGLVTEAELNANIQECAEKTKKLADSLGSTGRNES